jgi:hypothetical protein
MPVLQPTKFDFVINLHTAVPSSTGRSNNVLYFAVQNIANGTNRT